MDVTLEVRIQALEEAINGMVILYSVNVFKNKTLVALVSLCWDSHVSYGVMLQTYGFEEKCLHFSSLGGMQ